MRLRIPITGIVVTLVGLVCGGWAVELNHLNEVALLMAYDEMGQECEAEGDLDRALFWYTLGMKTHPSFYDCRFVRFNIRDRHDLEVKLSARRPAPSKGEVWCRERESPGSIVYVYAEEGLGDTIQFSRYLRCLSQEGYRVLFRPQPELASLMEGSLPKEVVIETSLNERDLPFDSYVPLLSLPHAYITGVDGVPSPNGYLEADRERVVRYQALMQTEKLKVGIVWQGSPGRFNDAQRSLPLVELLPLADIPGVQLFSLQKGAGSEQLDTVPAELEIVDLGATFQDFADTAAAVENLDVLVSVDTSVAHLGGAMGKQTWILIPYLADWRWFRKGCRSPWYCSATLYRQEFPADWSSALLRIEERLFKMVGQTRQICTIAS